MRVIPTKVEQSHFSDLYFTLSIHVLTKNVEVESCGDVGPLTHVVEVTFPFLRNPSIPHTTIEHHVFLFEWIPQTLHVPETTENPGDVALNSRRGDLTTVNER